MLVQKLNTNIKQNTNTQTFLWFPKNIQIMIMIQNTEMEPKNAKQILMKFSKNKIQIYINI